MALFGRGKGRGGGRPEPTATNSARPEPPETGYGGALTGQQDAPAPLETPLPAPEAAGLAAPPEAQPPAGGGHAAGVDALGGLGNLEEIFEDDAAAVDPAYQSLVDSVEEVDAARLSQELAAFLRMLEEG